MTDYTNWALHQICVFIKNIKNKNNKSIKQVNFSQKS